MKKSILSLALALLAAVATAQGPQVRTACGVVEGTCESGIKVFKGIPFAAPPTGPLRWKAPQPAARWQGVRKATEFGPNPMQQPIYGDMNFGTKKMSEDCLYLNIWTPAKSMDEKLPVLIYFNGGGLMAGSGSEPRYAGMSMARKGIVAVTANYREGIFGFFAHPDLSKETAYKGSGNYGFMDQAAAIQWLRDNIAAFGGDPDRITIAGESAGSMSVSALMASPVSRNLFCRAIGSSGSVIAFGKIATLKEAEKAGKEKMKQMGCKSLEELRALSADELMERAAVRSRPAYNIDGYFFTEQPEQTFAGGRQARVPLLVGGNSEEAQPSFILQGKPATVANATEAARAVFGSNAEKVVQLYGISTDADVSGEPGLMLASDIFIGFGTWKWAHMHTMSSGQPVYRYVYCHPRPAMRISGKVAGLAGGLKDKDDGDDKAPEAKGAVHSADIEYAMGTLPTNRVFDWQPEDFLMSDIFSGYYANFIKTGSPNGLGLPDWTPANGQEAVPVLRLDVNTTMTTDRQTEERYKLIDTMMWGTKK